MVESNNVEERLARIEQIVETLQRESATMKRMAAALVAVAVELAPSLSSLVVQRAAKK